MSLITFNDFKGEIHLAQLSQLDVQESLQIFIDKYEPQVLRNLLGQTLYDALVAGMATPPPIPSEWTRLMDGTEYGDSNEDYWPGLRILVASYVYWFFMFDYNTHTVQVGVAKPKSENATPASPVHKMVRAWNEFVDLTCEMHDFIKANPDDYPGYKWSGRSSICENWSCGCGGYDALYKKKNSIGL